MILNAGIFGTIVGVEDDAFLLRIDDKTKDQGPEERRGRPPGARDREDGEVMPPALQNPFALWLLLTAALAGLVYAFMRPELRLRAILYGVVPPRVRGGDLAALRHGTACPARSTSASTCAAGIHLVLQVVVDDALNATVDDAVQTARDQATRKGIGLHRCSASRRRPSPSRGSSPRA